jgi:cytochrome c heme-lyase
LKVETMGGSQSKESPATVQSNMPSSAPSNISSTSTAAAPTNVQQDQSKSGCPMHNEDGSYSYNVWSVIKGAFIHAPGAKKELPKEAQDKARSVAEAGGCPVKHNPPAQESSSGCPVKHDSKYPEYNVYSQPIDKTNQMPSGVKTQMPSSYQKGDLSTERVSSSIPKGATESSTWTYPSPQQFYNALVRKGKLDADTSEEDMESVVALHNNMNEKTWATVVEWEKQIYSDTESPKLLKFQGRPHDLSPKATLKHFLLGHPLPYDRHDWTVLRSDGTVVRYVIDYYYDETRARETPDSAKPSKDDRNATPSLLIDVRPALDGPSELIARAVQMPYSRFTNQTTFEPLPLRGTPELANQVKESVEVWQSIQKARQQEITEEVSAVITEAQAKEVAINFAKALKSCQSVRKNLERCETDEQCGRASMDMTMCMGKVLCPIQHKALAKVLDGDDDPKIEAAFETLSDCVALNTARRRQAKEQFPEVFQ